MKPLSHSRSFGCLRRGFKATLPRYSSFQSLKSTVPLASLNFFVFLMALAISYIYLERPKFGLPRNAILQLCYYYHFDWLAVVIAG